jgi:hypothetical protein
MKFFRISGHEGALIVDILGAAFPASVLSPPADWKTPGGKPLV